MLTATQLVAAIEFGLSATPLDSPETSRRISAVIVQLFRVEPAEAASCTASTLLAFRLHGLNSIPSDPAVLEIMADTIMKQSTGLVTEWARSALRRAQGMTSPTWINLRSPLRLIAETASASTGSGVTRIEALTHSHGESVIPPTTSAEGPLSLPEDGTPRYVIQSAVQEETFEQMCLRLNREGSPELAQEDSVDLDPPPGAARSGSSVSTEPDLPPVGLEPSRPPEAVGFAPGQDDTTFLKASAEELAAIDQSIRETLERELGGVDVAPDAIDLGEPLAELDLVDELELELDDATDDGLLGGGTASPASP
jgi:hypothetical protein